MAPSWEDILNNAATVGIDKGELKEALSIEHVCMVELHVHFEEQPDGKLVALCPFHEDKNPSFDIFGDNMDRVGCWSCGWQGDAFDVIQATRECSFVEALSIGEDILKEQVAPAQRNAPRRTAQPSREDLRITARASYRNALDDLSPLEFFVLRKHLNISAESLRDDWYVGVASYAGIGTILIPHLGIDRAFLGYKIRTVDTPTISARGSKFTEMYGTWRDRGYKSVILCEGESDTWACSDWFGDKADVFGLPTGAQTRIKAEWLKRLHNRNVFLMFDGDEAGRSAGEKWMQSLPIGVQGVRVDLPDGEDCVSAGRDTLRQLMEEAYDRR